MFCPNSDAEKAVVENAYDGLREFAQKVVRDHINTIRYIFVQDVFPDSRIDQILVEEIQKALGEIFPNIVEKRDPEAPSR